jgi:D-alanine--poly(phosphoribitol) ligase subunit 2
MISAACGVRLAAYGAMPAAAGARPPAASRRPRAGQHREGLMKDMILEYIKNEYIDEDEADEIVLDENTPLISSGIVDSFSMVSLKRFLEKKYVISIPDEEASPEAFNTVTSIIALVNRHTAKKG